MDKVYTCYLITNTVNNKKYIGQTYQQPEKRWKYHRGFSKWNTKTNRHLLHQDIKLFGVDKFTFEVLVQTDVAEDISFYEKQFIKIYNTHCKNGHGYNMTNGGHGVVGYVFTEEVRLKMSLAQKGKTRGPRSQKDKDAISEAKKGISTHKPGQAERHSQFMTGRTRPQEEKDRIATKMKAVWAERKKHA